MPLHKTSKRPRVEDPEQDTSQPMAKRLNQLDLTELELNHDMQHGNDPSTVQLQLTSNSEEAYGRMVLEWQRSGGSEPDLVMSTPGVCGTEMPASDSPYYKENKVLFDAHVQWIQRHMPGYFSP